MPKKGREMLKGAIFDKHKVGQDSEEDSIEKTKQAVLPRMSPQVEENIPPKPDDKPQPQADKTSKVGGGKVLGSKVAPSKSQIASKGKKGQVQRRRRTPDHGSFKLYIFKILKQRSDGMTITKKSMDIMDDFMKHMFEVIATEAASLVQMNKRTTMLPWDIEAATRLHLTGELALHAVSEGTKALKRYMEKN